MRPQAGEWHDDGGARLLGYRVFVRRADEPSSAAVLRLSSLTPFVEVDQLPPQTTLIFSVMAENELLAGLNSTELTVATAALRATLWTDCGFTTHLHERQTYQGCFRDYPSHSDMQPAPYLPQPSHSLTAVDCATSCAGSEYFGLRGGNKCLCAARVVDFGRFGAVSDSECDAPCTGEAKRWCGGANRTSVYRQAGRRGVLLGAGKYKTYDMLRMGMPARALSSVDLPAGLVLTLYRQDHFAGEAINLTSATPCLASVPCRSVASGWIDPPSRCAGGSWNDEAASLILTYSGLQPAYQPRPSGETGARAFDLGVAGPLARLYDLGGDLTTPASSRPADASSREWRAPHAGDGDACTLRPGSYTSDQICLQSSFTPRAAKATQPFPARLFEQAHQNELAARAPAGSKPEARVSWNRTGGPRQLWPNRRPASAGVEPEAHVSWGRAGGPRQLESNRRPASGGIEPEARVSCGRTGGPRQLGSNRRPASAGVEPEACVSWNQTGDLRQVESNRRPASAGVEPEARVSCGRTGGLRQVESNRRPASGGIESEARVSWGRAGGPRQLWPNRRPASAGVEPEARVSWSRTADLRQVESNRRPASAGVEPEARLSWGRTGGLRQVESNRRPASARSELKAYR